MGDAADHYTEYLENKAMYPFGIDVLFADPIRDKNRDILSEYVWTTKDGQEIKFKDMDLPHLLNVVKMQERRRHKFAPQLLDYYQYRSTIENAPLT